MMASTLKELIEELPEALQPIADKYASSLLTMSQEELTAWIGNIVIGQTGKAHSQLINRMSTPQLVAAGKSVNDKLKALNKKNYDRIVFQQEMLKQALSVGILLLKAKLL